MICDNEINIVALDIFPGKVYDGNTITDTIKCLNKCKYRKINLVGDKGYAKKKVYKDKLLKDYKVNLIYPQKKNQKKQTTKINKDKLKNRYKVEHSILQIKNCSRLTMRRDKLDVTFKSFIFFAVCISFLKNNK